MKPPLFQYHRPDTLTGALALLADLPNPRLLAGGQSLMPLLNFRIAFPDNVIDINRVGELSGIDETADRIVIGAMTRQRALEHSSVVQQRLPLVAEALQHVGHRATRNRGTIGGSLCHLDPAAELPLVAAAYEVTLRVASRRGVRSLPMRDFPAGLMTPALEPDEMLTAVEFHPWAAGHGWGFAEFARGHGAFALAAAAALIELDAGKIVRCSIYLGGVAPSPLKIAKAEQILLGAEIEDRRIAAAAAACGEIDPMEDAATPAWYRRRLSTVLAQRALVAACARATRGTVRG